MKQFQLSVSSRLAKGSREAGRLRRSGQVPAVIYGKKSAPRALSIDEKTLRHMMRQVGDSLALVEVDDNGSKALALLQHVHRHPTTDRLVHVDFHEVDATEPLHIHVPVHVRGEAPGVVTQGGMLNVVMHRIDIKALPKNLPSSIDIDISNLKIGEAIHVSELPVLEGVSFLAEADAVVVACSAPLVEEPEPVAEVEAPAKPGAKKGTTAAPMPAPAKGKK